MPGRSELQVTEMEENSGDEGPPVGEAASSSSAFPSFTAPVTRGGAGGVLRSSGLLQHSSFLAPSVRRSSGEGQRGRDLPTGREQRRTVGCTLLVGLWGGLPEGCDVWIRVEAAGTGGPKWNNGILPLPLPRGIPGSRAHPMMALLPEPSREEDLGMRSDEEDSGSTFRGRSLHGIPKDDAFNFSSMNLAGGFNWPPKADVVNSYAGEDAFNFTLPGGVQPNPSRMSPPPGFQAPPFLPPPGFPGFSEATRGLGKENGVTASRTNGDPVEEMVWVRVKKGETRKKRVGPDGTERSVLVAQFMWKTMSRSQAEREGLQMKSDAEMKIFILSKRQNSKATPTPLPSK
uniref:Uncharacterized protein n=1 Tax=Chromera velia CCMP2878 TaxID=1169474 RepID=A0A0G4HL54_9ALVE|eukprot:Cvel_28658.t1-p1 / transcript=Cvel_28658.t1 / gene=Cvel_28658 / organism=Chromera_velia_CCMP2878 / gene_product=hypothetical protein / transcript_product=hypothetical protein / location=Cvel_scaffold3793:3533-4629(-) / protein_length=344 / sequence_SO=supercontig / SO=protein_coding / is_pseudo=false